MKNILITGGAGFIGSNFAALALSKGYKVYIVDKMTYAGNEHNLIDACGNNSDYELTIGDICNEALIAKLLEKNNIDQIFNFAAESHVDNSIESPGEFIHTNIVGSFNLLQVANRYYNKLDSAKRKSFRFIQISTDEVFGSSETGLFSETSPIKPSSPYSASKAAAEHLVRAWNITYSLPIIITNCSNNYGPNQNYEKLIPKIIKSAVNHQDIPIYGDGKNVRDWIHVYDHCHGVLLAAEKGNIGETYCFGGNAECDNNTIVRKICGILQELRPNDIDYKTLIKYISDRPGHDRRYAVDSSKAESKLGFTRKYGLDSGLKQTVEWYLRKLTIAD